MEGTGGHEEDVVGLHLAVLGLDGRAFDDREDVALHAFSGNVGTAGGTAACDLVDLIDEDDAAFFGVVDGFVFDDFHIDHLIGSGFREDALRVADGDFLLFHLLWHHGGEHHGNLIRLFVIGVPRISFLFHFDLDHTVVKVAVSDARLKVLSSLLFAFIHRCLFLRFAEDDVHGASCLDFLGGPHGFCDAVDRFFVRILAVAAALFFLHEADGFFGKVADHGLDVATDVADFGVLGRFDFDEGGAGEGRDAAGDLCLADTGRPDEKNVLRAHLFRHFRREAAGTPAVSKGDGYRSLRIALPDDVLVQIFHDFSRGQVCIFVHQISSTMTL